MNTEELSTHRTLIENSIREIEDQIPYLTEETQAIAPSVSLGRLTRMEALSDKAVNEHILAEARARIERLRNSLTRIENGTYGTCVRCGQPIPLGRLQLVPEALICVPCSEKKR